MELTVTEITYKNHTARTFTSLRTDFKLSFNLYQAQHL